MPPLYAPVAPYDGILTDIPPELKTGDWLKKGEFLGRFVRPGEHQVITYVSEDDIHKIHKGDRALFMSDGLEGPSLRLEIADIDRHATGTLEEAVLANPYGGHVSGREKNGYFYPERAMYRVVLTIRGCDIPTQHSWRGDVVIAGSRESPGLRFLRSAMNAIWREAGF